MHFSDLERKTPAKFKKDWSNIVGAVAFTRLDTTCDGQSDGRTGTWGKTDPGGGNLNNVSKNMQQPT